MAISVYEKLWWALVSSIYRNEEQAYPCILMNNGLIYETEDFKGDIEEYGEMIIHEMLVYSKAFDYCLTYYLNSPYWEAEVHLAKIDEASIEKLTPEEREDFVYLTEMEFDDFFEEKALDMFRMNTAQSPLEYFDVGDDADTHSCAVFKSYLLPYYISLDQELLMKEHPDLRNMVEFAIKTINRSLADGCQSILEEGFEASYFILFDGYDMGYGGVSYINKGLALAGKVIDDAIHELNSYYRFLPETLM